MANRTRSAWPSRREGVLIVGFWAMLIVILISSRVFGYYAESREIEWFTVARTATTYIIWALLTPCIFWLAARHMLDRPNLTWRLPMHLSIAIAVSIAVHLGVMLLCMHVFSLENPCPFRPLHAITRFLFINEFMIYSAVLAAGFARVYSRRQREGEVEAQELRMQKARLEARLSTARLDALRMQLNPHFLFNTLHSISTLVEGDPQGVRRMIARLSDLLRCVLEENERQEIPLHQEVRFLQDYLDIQMVRFAGRLVVEMHIAPEVQNAMVPTFILQPIVENTVKHGAECHSGPTHVVLRGYREQDLLVLSVSDNGGGSGSGPVDITFGTGLNNVSARLEALYGETHDLEFRQAREGGLQVIIRLPYHEAGDLFVGVENGAPTRNGTQDEVATRHDD